MDPYTQKCVGALIGTFVGDALGMPVEGQPAEAIAEKHGDMGKMIDARLGRGTYTDDTQMMIATARSLVENEGINREDLADQYLDHYDSKRGYGAGTTRVFERWQNGESIDEASSKIFNGGSYGNGAAMRIAPVGVLFNQVISILEDGVRACASLTHAHPLGVGGAFIQARAVAEAITTVPPGDQFYPDALDRERAVDFLETVWSAVPHDLNPDNAWDDTFRRTRDLLVAHDHPPDPAMVATELGCSSTTPESVLTAMFSVLVCMDSFEKALKYAVRIGGDTDTIGAMTGAISGALYGVGHVPDRWWDALENGDDGRDAVVLLGEELADLSREVLSRE